MRVTFQVLGGQGVTEVGRLRGPGCHALSGPQQKRAFDWVSSDKVLRGGGHLVSAEM